MVSFLGEKTLLLLLHLPPPKKKSEPQQLGITSWIHRGELWAVFFHSLWFAAEWQQHSQQYDTSRLFATPELRCFLCDPGADATRHHKIIYRITAQLSSHRSSSISLKTLCITADSSSISNCLASFPNLTRSLFDFHLQNPLFQALHGRFGSFGRHDFKNPTVQETRKNQNHASHASRMHPASSPCSQKDPQLMKNIYKASRQTQLPTHSSPSSMLPNFSQMLRASPCRIISKAYSHSIGH